jgi:hypothetical protein
MRKRSSTSKKQDFNEIAKAVVDAARADDASRTAANPERTNMLLNWAGLVARRVANRGPRS